MNKATDLRPQLLASEATRHSAELRLSAHHSRSLKPDRWVSLRLRSGRSSMPCTRPDHPPIDHGGHAIPCSGTLASRPRSARDAVFHLSDSLQPTYEKLMAKRYRTYFGRHIARTCVVQRREA